MFKSSTSFSWIHASSCQAPDDSNITGHWNFDVCMYVCMYFNPYLFHLQGTYGEKYKLLYKNLMLILNPLMLTLNYFILSLHYLMLSLYYLISSLNDLTFFYSILTFFVLENGRLDSVMFRKSFSFQIKNWIDRYFRFGDFWLIKIFCKSNLH